jgi:hypothetical protein
VSERIANIVVLAEDQEQQNLIRRYLERCGHNVRAVRFVSLPAKTSGGSGEKYVRDNYPNEVRACRSTLGRRASALLVVMIDADSGTTGHRAAQLASALAAAHMDARDLNEPIVVLIPKRHVETWIRASLGDTVDEDTDYKNPAPSSTDIRNAAAELYNWTRSGAQPPDSAPPSLKSSMPEWRKI